MATSKGVIQGYTGVAAVDTKHQIIIAAQAHGTGSEQELLIPVIDAMKDALAQDTLITADAGYHSEANLKQLAEMEVEALIADTHMRSRDERFAGQNKYKALRCPTRFTTRTVNPNKPHAINRKISTTMQNKERASARLAKSSTATAATARSTTMRR